MVIKTKMIKTLFIYIYMKCMKRNFVLKNVVRENVYGIYHGSVHISMADIFAIFNLL